MKSFSIWSLIATGMLLLFGGFWFWHHYSLPLYNGNFEYKAQIISSDNFYSGPDQAYTGEVLSKTLFSFHVKESYGDSLLLVDNIFDVRKPSGEKIFSVNRTYGISPKTGAHKPPHGDRDRKGYLFAPPKNTQKDSFDYWHINYDQPVRMGFLRTETIQGLEVDCYQSNFTADQTRNLQHVAGVPERRGIELDVELTIWVEPKTGYLIKYKDAATAWFYDIESGKRLHPWNHFKNKFEELSVSRKVAESKIRLQKLKWNLQYIPGIFWSTALTILLIGYKFKERLLWRLYFSVGLVAAIGVSFSFLFYQSISENNQLKLEKDFDQESESIRLALKREIDASLSTLYPLRSLFSVNERVSSEHFSNFAGEYLKREQINHSVAWAPIILRKNRKQFEESVSKNGLNDFCIYSELLFNEKRCAGDQAIYCPVTYIEPIRGNKAAIGFDLLSDETRRQVLSEASNTGEIAASSTINLVQDRAKNKAIILALSVSDSAGNPMGYVTAPIRILDLFSNAFSSKQANPYLQVVLKDETGQELYRMFKGRTDEKTELMKTSTVQIGNKNWTLEFSSLPAFGAIYESSFQHFILIGGVTLSLVLATFFYFLLTDNRRALMTSNKRLEAELLERQKAEEKLVEIEQFAYIASHDLQEPLRTIRSYIQLIQENFKAEVNEDVGQFMNTITRATKRMQELINDLLDYSKVGKEDMKQAVDSQELVEEILQDLEVGLADKKAEVEFNNLPEIHGFRSGLKSVFQNLINNGVKFQAPGNQPKLKIEARELKNEFEFSVSDNGIGIENKHFSQIFVIFRRLYHPTEYSGTGIGLAQCKKIIELHGGRIWLESKTEEGTTFYFTIPKTAR